MGGKFHLSRGAMRADSLHFVLLNTVTALNGG